MEIQKPPYNITEKMLMLVGIISEKIGSLTAVNELDKQPNLRKNNRIKSIQSSLAIEANSLSLDKVTAVIDGHPVLGDKREIQEVKNAYAAYDLIEDIDPYSLADLKTVHGIMTKYLINQSGIFRTGNEGVFEGDKCIFMAPPPELVPGQMENLFNFMKANRNVIHPLILSAIFHYEFVFIHPFSDGNGRMARLWHTLLLYRWNNIFEYIPLESQIEKFQSQYYAAIAECHKNGNSNVFIEFSLEKVNEILDDLR